MRNEKTSRLCEELEPGKGRLNLPCEPGALYLGDMYDDKSCQMVAVFVGGDEKNIRHYRVPYSKSELDVDKTVQEGTTHLGLRGFSLWRNILREAKLT